MPTTGEGRTRLLPLDLHYPLVTGDRRGRMRHRLVCGGTEQSSEGGVVDVLGIRLADVDPSLRAATDDLRSPAATATAAGAAHVEPSHVVLALSRVPNGLAASYLAASGVPVDVLADSLRRPAGPDGPPPPIDRIDATTASAATRELFAALAARIAGGEKLTERVLLSEALGRLEAPVADHLVRYARIDPAEWARSVEDVPRVLPVFREPGGALEPATFGERARAVLDATGREAGALGAERLSTALLLHTMAATPGGLLESGLSFQLADVRGVRARLLTLVRGRPRRSTVPVAVSRSTMDGALVLALQDAAASASRRSGDVVREADLLVAMAELPGGVVAGFLRDSGVDTAALLRFATTYHHEPASDSAPVAGRFTAAERADVLRSRLIGQPDVVARLEPYIERIVLGDELDYRDDDRPAATFLFCGPSGTGKTLTARLLAQIVYGTPDAVLMFEMGQFNSHESINNFVGAPPGYVGFNEGKLTNGLRDDPRRVLLFDEVEKADRRVYDALLRLLDEGRISDPAGPVRDARESVIVLTSNAGSDEFTGSVSSTPSDETGRAVLLRYFRPELLNRVDEIVVFESFDQDTLRDIAVLTLERERDRLRERLGVGLTWSPAVPGWVAARATDQRRDEEARGVTKSVADLRPRILRLLHRARTEGTPLRGLHLEVVGGVVTCEPS